MTPLRLHRQRQAHRDDDGQVLIALLGMLAMTTVVLVGLAAVLLGIQNSRHDTRFERALGAAETGLDKLITQIRATPFAASFAPMSGSSGQTSWSVSATGSAGHWVLNASGTVTDPKGTVTRVLSQNVDVSNPLDHPLFADTALTLGGDPGDAGVDRYDSAVSSSVCGSSLLGTGLFTSGARMCTPASPALGAMGTNGGLTMKGGSLSNVSGVDIYDAGVPGYASAADPGKCVGDTSACASSKVTLHDDRLDYPMSSLCQKGIGAGAGVYDGSLALAANAVYSFTDVTLNVTAIANLQNLAGSTIVICFSGTLIIPPAVPLNFLPDSLLPPKLAPRPPATLLLISTQAASGAKPKVSFGLPGALNLGLPVSLSGVVYAPNAECSGYGHVDVYGAVVCGSLDAQYGMNVHYDTQLGSLGLDNTVSISHWTEVSG